MDVFFKWVRKDFIYFMSIFTEKFTGNRHIFRMQDLDQMSNEMPSCCTCNRYFVDEGAKIECKHYRINLSKDRTFMRRLCLKQLYLYHLQGHIQQFQSEGAHNSEPPIFMCNSVGFH